MLCGIACICVFIVDWIKRCGSMDGFGAIVAATIIFCGIAGFNVYAMKHPVEIFLMKLDLLTPTIFFNRL